jgi:hypothetical protein
MEINGHIIKTISISIYEQTHIALKIGDYHDYSFVFILVS